MTLVRLHNGAKIVHWDLPLAIITVESLHLSFFPDSITFLLFP